MFDGTNMLWNLPGFFPDMLEEEGIHWASCPICGLSVRSLSLISSLGRTYFLVFSACSSSLAYNTFVPGWLTMIKTVIYGRTAMILLGFLAQMVLLSVGYILLRNYSYLFPCSSYFSFSISQV